METPQHSLLDVAPSRRRLLVGGVALGTVGLGTTLTAGPAAASTATLYNLVDSSRRAAGKRTLMRSTALQTVAKRWAAELARSGRLRHNPYYSSQIPRGWRAAGENVGYVGGATKPEHRLHRMWLDSPGHRANILGSYTHIGIGRVIDARGRLWGVQVFARY
jgi:uncharacterized protein YkwD